MGMIDFYAWLLPNKNAFLNKYKENDTLYNQALSFWNSLDSACMIFLITSIVMGFIAAVYYYYGYNRLPGRKYKIVHWLIWLGITAIATIGITMLLAYLSVKTNLSDLSSFSLRISLANSIYALAIYFISSFIICNIPTPTNAYRFLKIGR